MGTITTDPNLSEFAAHLSVAKMPAHWLMARLGKRVLRPGGIETTRWLLEQSRIGTQDDVIELAPGLGLTAGQILARRPRSYVGVERDADAAAHAERALAHDRGTARIVRADAAHVPLPDSCASVVLGEAMLSMQPEAKKLAIASEARRLLREDGRYSVHELAVTPDEIDPDLLRQIEKDLSESIRVGVRIGTVSQWRRWLDDTGFEVAAVTTAPMRLLEPSRLIRDEGPWRAARFLFNSVRVPGAASRLFGVRAVFRKYETNLCAVAIVALRRGGATPCPT